ncbi:hypothetical protein J7E71_17190 [Mesobacillus foraminis]|uniref:CBO0543 family protein n=1 Tax=Mesobacillus foraminis TaxID=279826 RepID=UPI001BE6710F|nr:CBO0543 family protein [Mesobacillus foraminis]MBT2757627.1 hypothetical protein [Mesobacillus foraminis]
METIIEIGALIAGLLLFCFGVPKSKRRYAVISILVMHALTWPLGFIVAEWTLIHYPVRFFDNATNSSFTFEYVIFPIISALFNIHYPRKRTFLKVLTYTSILVSFLTIGEVILEKYTDNIEYINWHWYWSWLSMFVFLHLAHKATDLLAGNKQAFHPHETQLK